MEMHEIYLVSSVHISLPIPLNEVNREWAKGTDDERSGSGMGCESKRHGEPRDRRHERDTKWRDEWRVARLSSFMFLVSLTLPLLSPRRAHEWSEWGNETNEERRETEWAKRERNVSEPFRRLSVTARVSFLSSLNTPVHIIDLEAVGMEWGDPTSGVETAGKGYDVMRECRGTWEQEIDSFWLVFPWLGS